MSGSGSLFASVIEDHLALKRRNGHLDESMPIDDFIANDPFENHPLFKTEDEARREEEETGEHPAVALEIPADTLTLPAAPPVEEREPLGWMETTTDQEFRWE
jgi:hypothetical protein